MSRTGPTSRPLLVWCETTTLLLCCACLAVMSGSSSGAAAAGAQRQTAFVSGNVVRPLREAFDICVEAYRDHGHRGDCRSLRWALAVLDFPQHHIPQRRPWAQESQLTLARDASRQVRRLQRIAHPSAVLLRRYLLPRPGNPSLSVEDEFRASVVWACAQRAGQVAEILLDRPGGLLDRMDVPDRAPYSDALGPYPIPDLSRWLLDLPAWSRREADMLEERLSARRARRGRRRTGTAGPSPC